MRFLLATALLLGVVHAPASAARANEQTRTVRQSGLEASVVRELNRVRATHSLSRLRPTPSLRTAARAHSKAMLDVGFFGHASADGTPFSDRIRRYYSSRGWRSWSVGEALLASQDPATRAEAIVAAWLESPPHREIVLSRSWRDVGIGALSAPSAPREFGGAQALVVTADFGRRR